MMKTAISWSAGKDSCLALLRAREAGHDVPVSTIGRVLVRRGISRLRDGRVKTFV